MAPLPAGLRNQLARAIQDARRDAEAGARKALQSLAVDLPRAHDSMENDQPARDLRGRLRAHGKRLGDGRDPNGAQGLDRLTHEVAYEHWHRMLFARFLAENHLLIEPSGQAISMEECEELARDQGLDPWGLAASYAQAMLPKIFRTDDPVLEVQLPMETRLSLERYLESLPAVVFEAEDALGWTYQFWQTERKDAVNREGGKIGAEELPAVTQLFTEHYMVLFLFHNTIGAWHAGKVLAANPNLADEAKDEEELRRAVRLASAGGYDFAYLRFVRERRDTDADGPPTGPWRPAAGTFDGWPRSAAELRVLDPCCGSGHFLVEGFELLTRLRIAEEGLSLERATVAVLVENLFGLEIDVRCTQIAAFNLALAAWKLAGRAVSLPNLNVSCAGLSVGGTREEWLVLLGAEAETSLRFAFGQIYDLFRKAPSIGSLIDPRRFQGGAMLDRKGTDTLLAALTTAVANAREAPERGEIGVAAQGLAKASELLRDRYTLVITNVPYLGLGKQADVLRRHVEDQFALGKADLATAFVQRCLDFCAQGGSTALVTPQNWLFLTRQRKLRQTLLASCEWNFVAQLGSRAFETISGEVVSVVLLILSAGRPHESAMIGGIDVSSQRGHVPISASEKATMLRGADSAPVVLVSQAIQSLNPDARISLEYMSGAGLLQDLAICRLGVVSGDRSRWILKFWEIPLAAEHWRRLQSVPETTCPYGGRQDLINWRWNGEGMLRPGADNPAFGRRGVAIGQMSTLPSTLYDGDLYDNNVAAMVPHDENILPALWTFCSSEAYSAAVGRIDKKIGVIHGSLLKVAIDLPYWQDIAARRYPNGVPEPESDDPTQWLFHGRPERSTDLLQVAVARLIGHRWPAELDPAMRLSAAARGLVRQCEDLLRLADSEGIVCIPSTRGNKPAADRLVAMLSACGLRLDRDLDEWLRNGFFEEHCRLFDHRPFIWHIWDGRPDGFHALVNYQRLVGPNGEGRRTLEALAFSHLGDWIDRQKADQRDGKDGADARLAAAQDLQTQLELILTGEPPCDIFTRWKPLREQPIGWAPDVNDGVRINIRPFMSVELRKGGRVGAGILRWRPNISWTKDRGAEPQSARPAEEFPWLWDCPGEGSIDDRTDFTAGSAYDGFRWNDMHYSNAAKTAAREKFGMGGEK